MPLKPAESCTLVVGSDSLIGGALMAHLQRAGQPVIGTTRRRAQVDSTHVYLDLLDVVNGWGCPTPISLAVVCAGVTSIESCTRDAAATARVNVFAVFALIEQLVAAGTFVIYLSSNAIFDGSVPFCPPDTPPSPLTEYGRQKAEAERMISQWKTEVAIVRLAKVLSPKNALLFSWAEALSDGKVIHPFSDMYLAPVPLSCVVSTLRLIGDLRLPGVLQLSGQRDLSYSEAASLVGNLCGAPAGLIQPIAASQSDRYSAPVPANTTLNIDRLRTVLGIEPPDVRWTVQTALTRPPYMYAGHG
jgi:dTDP-4-dehydrorhamnose reductase